LQFPLFVYSCEKVGCVCADIAASGHEFCLPKASVSRNCFRRHPSASVSQVEFCDNLIFYRRAALDKLGERLLDANRTIGQPNKITVIFGRKITKQHRGKLQTEIEDMDLPNPVIRSHCRNDFIKQYAPAKAGGKKGPVDRAHNETSVERGNAVGGTAHYIPGAVAARNAPAPAPAATPQCPWRPPSRGVGAREFNLSHDAACTASSHLSLAAKDNGDS
jgi:hypothetical protein